MPALFKANAGFTLPSRRLFVVSGEILSGVVKKGMTMKVRVRSSVALSLRIERVEFVFRSGVSEVALTAGCQDERELSMLQALSIAGRRIEIEDPEGPEANNQSTTEDSGASPGRE
jgi:hypothetical protein